MKQLLHTYHGNIAVIDIDGEKFLGLRISSRRKSFSLVRYTKVKNSPGFCFKDGEIYDWSFVGTCEIGGHIYFYGPYMEGRPLLTVINSRSESEAVSLIRLLCDAFIALPDMARPIYLNSLYINPGADSVTVFPPKVMELIAQELDEEERKIIRPYYYSPRKSTEENAVFFLAALSYYLCTRRFYEDILPDGEFVPPHLQNTALPLEISKLIESGILHPEEISAGYFKNGFLKLSSFHDPILTEEEMENRDLMRRRIMERKSAAEKRKSFVRTHGWKFLVIVVIGSFGGILGGRMIYRATRPPVTVGMTEEEVIRMFYENYNALNPEGMEEYIVKGKKPDELQTSINLFVISRIRQAYEGKNPIIPAEEWESGEYDAESDEQEADFPLVFGVTDIRVNREGGNTFTVTYKEYIPGRQTSVVTERVRLEYQKGGWLISDITEIKRKNAIY